MTQLVGRLPPPFIHRRCNLHRGSPLQNRVILLFQTALAGIVSLGHIAQQVCQRRILGVARAVNRHKNPTMPGQPLLNLRRLCVRKAACQHKRLVLRQLAAPICCRLQPLRLQQRRQKSLIIGLAVVLILPQQGGEDQQHILRLVGQRLAVPVEEISALKLPFGHRQQPLVLRQRHVIGRLPAVYPPQPQQNQRKNRRQYRRHPPQSLFLPQKNHPLNQVLLNLIR